MSLAQSQTFSLIDNLHPVTPTASQFVKYDELPISEYTGIPNISIPLYEINEDGVKIPIDLSYHAGGIHVNEEASWVGLGWDMTVGSIVQTVNDQDDLNSSETKARPDFAGTSAPDQMIYKYEYANCGSGGWLTCNYGCNGPIEVQSPRVAEGFMIYTDQWAPYSGDYGYRTPKNYKNFFYSHNQYNIDSEPDIFSMNVPGGSIKFIFDWNSNGGSHFIVLNKRGYNIYYNGTNLLQVMFPTGDEYDFTRMNTVQSSSTSGGESGSGVFPGGSSVPQPSSIIWMLTRIITKNKKTITFNYTVPAATYNVFPSYTQKRIAATLIGTQTSANQADYINALISGTPGTGIGSTTLATQSFSQEYYITLSSIVFPKGQVSFYTDTTRSDLFGCAKLDSIAVSNVSSRVKSYYFNYSYFNAVGVGGNGYTVNVGTRNLYRLRLDSLRDNNGEHYRFSYNSTQLPEKNSFAIDYWGFYNGNISNTTVVPNGSQFVKASLGINYTSWGNNGDNHSANVAYTQAGILTQITYPTGGSVNFNYELNQFSNYWVPDYSGNTNNVSSGNGLRINSIIWKDITGNQLKQTNYTYSGGIAITPLSMFRQYGVNIVGQGNVKGDSFPSFLFKAYSINESNMTGYFSSNPLASINGVGYSQVIKTDIDTNGNTNGSEVEDYYNTPDVTFNNSVETISQVDAVLPSYKDSTRFDNGSLLSDLYYDSSNHLLKKITNSYAIAYSPISYGARVFGYGDLCTWNCTADASGANEQTLWSQTMVGYYPIYDCETFPLIRTETDYFGTDSLSTIKTTIYDFNDQLSQVQEINSDGTTTHFDYSYPGTNNPAPGTVLANMVTANRFSDVVNLQQGRWTQTSSEAINSFSRSFTAIGNLFVAKKDTTYKNVGAGYAQPDLTTYDLYDLTNANIGQYSKNGVPTSLLWDYNKEYVTADVKNAVLTNIAYTSFEADGTGRWKFTGTSVTDSKAPTGTKAYSLANGNIYRDSLDATQTYVVSYWSKNGVQTVSGSSAVKQGYSYNGYTYFEHTVIAPSAGTVTISGTGTIDELRLYPNTAQMTSYTYQPLVGISSEDSPGGKISYYQYDSSQRLINVIDQYGNIIKHMSYHYQGQ